MYPITTLTAVILGLWLVVLSIRVVDARRSQSVSLGDGDNELLTRRIRAQGNLSEYAPIGLILLLLAEAQGCPVWLVALIALVFVTGRLMHGIAFSFTSRWVLGRFGGMVMTFTAIGLLALTNLALLLLSLG